MERWLKGLPVVLATCLSCLLASPAVADDFNWIGALSITVPYGTTNTLENPYYLPAAMQANYVRFSISQYCPLSIQQFGVWGQGVDGQRVPLFGELVQTENDLVRHETRYIYRVNYGQPIGLREIGFLASTNVMSGCQLLVDEALQTGPIPTAQCGMDEPCSGEPDATQGCSAYPADPSDTGTPIFQEDATVGEDNQCMVLNRLRDNICAGGYLPSQFQITCH